MQNCIECRYGAVIPPIRGHHGHSEPLATGPTAWSTREYAFPQRRRAGYLPPLAQTSSQLRSDQIRRGAGPPLAGARAATHAEPPIRPARCKRSSRPVPVLLAFRNVCIRTSSGIPSPRFCSIPGQCRLIRCRNFWGTCISRPRKCMLRRACGPSATTTSRPWGGTDSPERLRGFLTLLCQNLGLR